MLRAYIIYRIHQGNIEEYIFWSDSVEEEGEYFKSRGSRVEFGPDITNSVFKNLGVELVIRSHQLNLALAFPYNYPQGKVVTISSTSIYMWKSVLFRN